MKKATTTFVFLISVLVLCPRLSLSAQPDSPATILHTKLEATRDVNQAQQLAIATTKNMSYPQLFDFWEEGCKKTWADVKTAARAELAGRWKEKPEMKIALDFVKDGKKDSSFRLELVDAIGYHKRKISHNERTDIYNSFKEILTQNSNPFEIRSAACHRLGGLIRLMDEKGERNADDYLSFTAALCNLLLNENEPPELRSEAAVCLGVVKYQQAEQLLLQVLERWHQLDLQITRGVMLGLGHLKSKKAVSKISEVLNETTDMPVYATAAVSLGMIGGTEVIDPLIKNRSRFPIPCCRSALTQSKSSIQAVVEGHDKTCALETAIEAYCLTADEQEWQSIFESLITLNVTANITLNVTAKKKVLQMAAELSPNLDGVKHIITQIKESPENKELYECADILLARMKQPIAQIDAQTGNTQIDIIPPAPNNQKGDK